ncbi:hypothetical protein [Lichenicoccus roseus]|uniref:Uncharacterized protein n=1 Tax=Lichenicoccus roseus TaxID=2683649 RepID=A0A5R9J212_9PROT|nr:hypothetical protein [Lichenicoccus roseus]TLU71675.1 hypothetical protein FE263_14480 [Lichenicoccus roseus]
MRGADPVNNELEVGFNADFEKRWHGAELVGRVLMMMFVLAAVTGLLGNGPLDHHTLLSSPEALPADSRLAIDYEPAVRYGTGTQITFHLGARSGADTVRLFLGSNIVEPFGLQQIAPQPQRSVATHDGMVLTFPVPPGASDVLVRVMAKPGTVGPVGLLAREDDGVELRWRQWVLP